MQWLKDMATAAAGSGRRSCYQSESVVHTKVFGEGIIRVQAGDPSGEGEPGMQIEIAHPYLPGPAAIALSADEAELLIGAIHGERKKLVRWLRGHR